MLRGLFVLCLCGSTMAVAAPQTIPQTTPQSAANEWTAVSGRGQNILLELYTSQGCSSCPPADHWLSQLKQHPQLFNPIIPISFHVTYWNYLGWKDPFGVKANDRQHHQRAYAADVGVYTPGVFANGGEWRRWRTTPTADIVGQSHEARAAGILTAQGLGKDIQVTFTPAEGITPLTKPTVFATYLSMGRTAQVRAGENRGRLLSHDFVASKIASAALSKTPAEVDTWSANLRLQRPVTAHAVALWIYEGNSRYIQAAATYLSGGLPTIRPSKRLTVSELSRGLR